MDVYLNVSIVFPRGYRLAWGEVVRRNINVDGNPIFWENKNTSLDHHQYEVEFTDDGVIELTANVIDDRMCAHCDKDINDMLLLDYFLDYRKTERALSLQDQKLTVNGKPCIKCLTGGWELCIP